MAVITNMYADALCTTPIYPMQPGQAGLVGYWADPANWTLQQIYTGKDDEHGNPLYIRATYINRDKNGNSVSQGCDFGLAASGGAILYDLRTSEDSFEVLDYVILEDTYTNGGQAFNNAFFSGVIDYGDDTQRSAFVRFSNGVYARSVLVQVGSYRQTPADADKEQRQTWSYKDYDGYDASDVMFCRSFTAEIASNSRWGFVRVYSLVLGGVDCYAFFVGVDFGGGFNDTGNYTSYIIAVPKDLYKDKIPRPYVGPVSKDSAAEFTPTTPKRDSIASRDLTGKKNPYGFNTGNGLKLLLLSAQEQADIVKRLYTGRSGDDLNAIGQTLSGVIGGNTHRPADELKTMIDAVLCCHIVPVISAGYAGGTNALYTVAGYQLYNPAKAVTQVSDQIITVTTLRTYIAPIVNNFLTYAPYCSVSLSVPFVGDIPLDTSALFASSIYFVFYLDLYTGTLSVDVHLVDDDGRDYIYTTRQTNCAVDIPIMGTGATGNPLQKIASAAGNVASAGVLGAPTAVYNVATATVDAQHATAIGRGASSNIAPYFSQRHCYLVIEYAESANADYFFALNGGALEKSGTVGEFHGYTEFSAVDVSGIAGATDAEKRQIEQILKGGVYL